MDETLQKLLIIIQNMMREGITVNSSISPISVFINIVTTLGATIVGGLITLNLYKDQERIRLKGELRIEFYKKYKVLYNQLLDLFIKYMQESQKVSRHIKYDNDGIITEVYTINANNDVTEDNITYEKVKDIESLIKLEKDTILDIKDKLEILEKFMKSNELITGFEEFKYKKINDQINDYCKNYYALQSHFYVLCSNNEENAMLNLDSFKEIKVNLGKEGEKIVMVSYKSILRDLDQLNQKFELLLNDFEVINKEIEQEFIGEYFKNK